MFKGIYTAIITPFKNGLVDEKTLEMLIKRQIDAGVSGVVALGTTGEFMSLTPEESDRILEICVGQCAGKLQVVAGCSRLTIEDTIAQVKKAKKIGVTGILLSTPWYIKPSQENLYHYYKKIALSSDMPLVIYNNPTRTGVEISLETLLKLTECPTVQGYKDSSSNLQRVTELKSRIGDRLSLLAGNDDPFAAHLGMGGDGGFMMSANLIPSHFVSLMNHWKASNLPAFQKEWTALFPLLSALALETNPTTLKYAMHLVLGTSCETRFPFESLRPTTESAIEKALDGLGLLQSVPLKREL